MPDAIVFFLAPDDDAAAAAHRGGPQHRFASVRGRWFDPDDAVADWSAHFADDPAAPPGTRVVVPLTNDGSETFALPPRLTRALSRATPEDLHHLAARWTARLRAEDGEDMTDDDLPALLRALTRLATTAVTTGGHLYCWYADL
ncbi:hypothetical protein Kpho02_03970 [Kitasatospora phosalacinea]|uniref:Uncharacterized protein n=1 Tax=Kitasatospora phosalacinea TaxID=2065 RepID=A0A9W6Q3Y7_9ACTN|nr:hypothetical protein [Kitasatospora phosalacinea]GLW68098.1 hypothetical protein Kpho02_03970 [Kitasatospora phosalacinea]